MVYKILHIPSGFFILDYRTINRTDGFKTREQAEELLAGYRNKKYSIFIFDEIPIVFNTPQFQRPSNLYEFEIVEIADVYNI